MLRSILSLVVMACVAAPAGAALVTINESGDFGGTNLNPSLSTNIGTITDSPVELIGAINTNDVIDAWTFTIPAGRTVTAINVTASGSDGVADYLDLYTSTTADPSVVRGDLLAQPLQVGNHAVSVGAGTYKLSALSITLVTAPQNYTIQIVSVPEPSAVAAVGLLAAGMLARRRRGNAEDVRRRIRSNPHESRQMTAGRVMSRSRGGSSTRRCSSSGPGDPPAWRCAVGSRP